ncbi:MAG: Bro-N domain-containing protein, partial [Candidatus Fonsibacter sp.]
MSEIVEFKFNNNAIACVIVDGNPWFKAKEVATILGYVNTKQAIIDHVDDEDKTTMDALMWGRDTPIDPDNRRAIFINEPGLYSL